jgi:DNA/RNA endonuclease YhcR with UshA esterase domain
MKGTYTSFNLYDTAQESYVFTVQQTGDDKFVITNANGKVMQYDPAYSSAGAYDTEKAGAIYPNLVSVAGAEIAEVLFAVEPTEVALDQAEGVFNINMTCKNEGFEIVPSVDWIAVKGMTSTNGEYVVTFSYEANDGSARTAAIDFISGEEKITVAVTQKGSAIVEISVADFLNAEVGPALYKLTGKIANIAMDKNDPTKVNAYGNFDLVDATGSVYVYGLTSTPQASNDKSFESLGLKEGDVVTIVGTRAAHNGTPQVGGPAYYVSHVAGGQEPEQPAAPTIASILALGADATVPADTYVEGVVISNLDLNNLTSKKGMYIQDETAGLQFYLAANHTFKFGDKVKVDLSGAKVGAYNGAVQISGIALDKIELISSGNTVTPKTVTIADFLDNKYEGQYVAIEGVQVAESDLSKTWVSGGAHTSIKIENADGKNFVVFSSKYATYGASTVAQGSGTLKGISSINNGNMQLIFAQESDFAGLTGARFGQGTTEPEPEQPETPAATNRADFETFDGYYGQYDKQFTSAAGWKTVNCAIQAGNTSDVNPQFICIDKVPGTDTWAKAVCINGKTSASGVLESPELAGGCGVLSFNYGNMFSEANGVSFKVEVIQNGSVVKELTFTKDSASVPQKTKLEGSLEVNVSGTFKLKFTNLCPTNSSSSNKDRVSIWNLTWTSVQ